MLRDLSELEKQVPVQQNLARSFAANYATRSLSRSSSDAEAKLQYEIDAATGDLRLVWHFITPGTSEAVIVDAFNPAIVSHRSLVDGVNGIEIGNNALDMSPDHIPDGIWLEDHTFPGIHEYYKLNRHQYAFRDLTSGPSSNSAVNTCFDLVRSTEGFFDNRFEYKKWASLTVKGLVNNNGWWGTSDLTNS